MSIRLAACALACLFLGPVLSANEHDTDRAQETILRQQLQHMLQSMELLQEAGETEIADAVAAKAEQIARRLTEMQQKREIADQAAQQRKRNQDERRWRADVMNRLAELTEMVKQLREEVTSLRDEVGQYKRSQRAKEFARVDLAGTWKLTLPAGYEHEAKISPRGKGLYQFDVPTVMRGVYRHRGDKVAIEIPSDERLTEFVWEFQDENLLMLIESPPVAKTGSDYRGAVLQRIDSGS